MINERSDFIKINIKYTSEMEKSMHGVHKMSYAEYENCHKKRIQVEKRRELEYKKEKEILLKNNL